MGMVRRRNKSVHRDQDENWRSKEQTCKNEKYSHKEESGFEFTSETGLVLHDARTVVWHGKLGVVMGTGKVYQGVRNVHLLSSLKAHLHLR